MDQFQLFQQQQVLP
ncbi:Putative uncharacterized protein [Lactococcus lactis subsp. lactis A12]|uniref:Uncharacterized protein n=1 Tax=Lactococcus lactis subsp. lactis A12 TaxID=1137134 RepID=S6F0Q6_LACLL|nr:Putative uncharacterized protein [Lactococcus lactis subsp. lactis A12]SBW29957.1 Hypothetical protein LLA12_00804 [Lactococcus lactis subsp. lactis]